MNLRILIADDHEFIRQGFRRLIASKTSHKVVGEAANGAEAVKMALKKKPDLIVMDVRMPVMDGAMATRRILAQLPETKVLAVSGDGEEKAIRRMFDAGASGFVLKASPLCRVEEALAAIARGDWYIDPAIMEAMARDRFRPGEDSDTSRVNVLTARQREVLGLIAEGLRAKEIADRLGLSVRTVEAHTQSIMQGLSIHSVAGLAIFAVKQGLRGDAPIASAGAS